MKRGLSVFILILLLSSLLLSVVYAQPVAPDTGTNPPAPPSVPDSSKGPKEVIDDIKGFTRPVLESLFGDSEYIFEQFLIGLVLLAILYIALSQVPLFDDRKWAVWLIAGVLSILSVRFIVSEKITETLLLPQSVLGVALITLLPFLLWFWFVEFGLGGATHRVLRKIAWSVFAATFAFLWYKQFYLQAESKVGFLNIGNWGYLYLIAAIIAVILMFLDKTIQNGIAESRARSKKEVHKQINLGRLHKELSDTYDDLANAPDDSTRNAAKTKIKEIEKRMDVVRKS